MGKCQPGVTLASREVFIYGSPRGVVIVDLGWEGETSRVVRLSGVAFLGGDVLSSLIPLPSLHECQEEVCASLIVDMSWICSGYVLDMSTLGKIGPHRAGFWSATCTCVVKKFRTVLKNTFRMFICSNSKIDLKMPHAT